MEELLLIIFYPIGWFLLKVFTLGSAKPEKWNWKQFFSIEETKQDEDRKSRYTISYKKTAALGLVAVAGFITIDAWWTIFRWHVNQSTQTTHFTRPKNLRSNLTTEPKGWLSGLHVVVKMKSSSQIHEYRFPLREIEKKYGEGNFDDAGDDIIEGLNSIEKYPKELKIEFQFETNHSNPWYHELIIKVAGMNEKQSETFSAFIQQNLQIPHSTKT